MRGKKKMKYIWTTLSFLMLFCEYNVYFPDAFNKKLKYGCSNLTNTIIIMPNFTQRG